MLVVRSPRFTICVLLLIFMTFIFFFRSDKHPSSILLPFSNRALQEKLRLEEYHYNMMLDGRAKLIEKWGPTPHRIHP